MNLSKGGNYSVLPVFLLLGMAFASYDLILWFAGHAHTLMNVSVQDGYRFDEVYMYFAGIGKTILFDPYLKEHAQDITGITLRPMLPTALFSLIYWLCGKNLDLAIFVGHVIPPLLSCWLIYRIALTLTNNKRLAIFSVLMAVGHFVFSLLAIAAKLLHQPAGGVAGPELYLLKQVFIHAGMLGNVTAPTQFARLFSPALTLPFLLLPIVFILQQSRPALRGVLIALNLYVYPHHVIVLGILELVAWVKNRRIPKAVFFIAGALAALPYAIQLWLVHQAGFYQEIYGRIGQTSDLSSMWFFVPLFGLTTIYIWFKEKTFTSDLILSLGCFLSAVLIYGLDRFVNFPQVHLVGIRIFAFLTPLVFVCVLKNFNLPRLKYFNAALLTLILVSYIHAGWVHRHEYSQFPQEGFVVELAALPARSVVMTQSQVEIPYISAMSDKYSYLSYGIASSASNEELMKRFVIVSRIYGWNQEKLHGGNWDGLMSTHHWIFHHGSSSKESQNDTIDQVAKSLEQLTPCQLLKVYEVNYIVFKNEKPTGLEACTQEISPHFLMVLGSAQ